jgi:hypothetical protein
MSTRARTVETRAVAAENTGFPFAAQAARHGKNSKFALVKARFVVTVCGLCYER